MEIYLDANATTPVLPQARAAALASMAQTFGNPSSVHGAGLRARAMIDETRERARRVLGAGRGRLLFTSGATEGIQTAVLSALMALKERPDVARAPRLLLYGATEHKAVPVALRHWNEVLALGLDIEAIPVDAAGRHDLAWLREAAPRAGLVCTMAANNETGVISDLAGIEQAIAGTEALWMVDGVQALGKLDLKLDRLAIDYAPFSGHKLYAPKGIGLLYVAEGAPFTPLLAGGGQEGELRAGTENTAGIAALGAVLRALEEHDGLCDYATLEAHRRRLADALADAFPGLAFNAPMDCSLATTLNFSVAGVRSKVLLDLFDAAGVRVSGGSACSASRAKPSDVLQAMGLPDWRASNSIRLSFGAADTNAVIDEACRRLRACGAALTAGDVGAGAGLVTSLVTRHTVDGACSYLVCPPGTGDAVAIDPAPETADSLAEALRARRRRLAAVLHTGRASGEGEAALRSALSDAPVADDDVERHAWSADVDVLPLGHGHRLTRLAVPGPGDACLIVLDRGAGAVAAFVGDALSPGTSDPRAFAETIRLLASRVGRATPLLPRQDPHDRHATTLAAEAASRPLVAAVLDSDLGAAAFAQAIARHTVDPEQDGLDAPSVGGVEMSSAALDALVASDPRTVLVDVREPYELRVGPALPFPADSMRNVPLSAVVSEIEGWLALPADRPIVFFCRSGNRSGQAARALRRLGRDSAWSLAGGLAARDRD